MTEIYKYPVKGLYDYYVEVSISDKFKEVLVEIKHSRFKFILLRNYKTLSTKTYKHEQYYKYRYDLKQCVIEAIKEYEEWLLENYKHEQNLDKAIEDFNNWDGKCE
jgi:hypothetical protein